MPSCQSSLWGVCVPPPPESQADSAVFHQTPTNWAIQQRSGFQASEHLENKRRARDSNPQPISRHLISSQTASRSLTLHSPSYRIAAAAARFHVLDQIKRAFCYIRGPVTEAETASTRLDPAPGLAHSLRTRNRHLPARNEHDTQGRRDPGLRARGSDLERI